MKILVYSAKDFEIPFLKQATKNKHEIAFTKERLTSQTAMKSLGFNAISIFSADGANPIVLEKLSDFGIKYITLRSTGHDNINSQVAASYNIKVANTPKYSPNAIAEHAIALLLSINRKLVFANTQVKQNNFSLNNLVGFDLNKKVVGILGLGNIGSVIAKILHGFGCQLLVNDKIVNNHLKLAYNLKYATKETIYESANVIIVCLPLNQETHYLFDEDCLDKIKKHPIIVNVARGAIVKTSAIIKALETEKLAGYGTDVYEKESGVFFYDNSNKEFKDKQLEQLINHPKVVLTPHQAFATKEALQNIAEATVYNLNCWETGVASLNELN